MDNKSRLPLQVLFRNLPPSEALEKKARTYVEKLEHYFDGIISCKIIIESSHHHQHKGNIYHVSFNLVVPGAELLANRNPEADHAHEDVYVAMRDAYDAIKRQLLDHVHKMRGQVKHHKPYTMGKIQEISPFADYGYIETGDGRRLRFSPNSVIDYDFSKLELGDEVRFVEAEGEEEAAASTVYIATKHHDSNK